MSTSLKRDRSRCCEGAAGLLVAGMVYAPVSGAWAGPKSRVLMETDFAVVGVVQLICSGWFAGTVAFWTGAFTACAPGLPTTTPWTLSPLRTTSSEKSPVGNDAFE